MTPAKERFEKYVERGYKFVFPLAEACWIWSGAKDKNGYGIFQAESAKTVRAHRWSYEQAFGVELAAQIVRHLCDTPSCVNPAHLIPGTHKDNDDDKVERGRDRYRKGSNHYGSKLSDDEVRQIRELGQEGRTHRSIAAEFGMSRSHITALIAGRKRPND